MKVKHLVISSCEVCPFMIAEGSPSDCPLEDYDTEMSPDSLVRNHVKERVKRWKEHNDHVKAGGSY